MSETTRFLVGYGRADITPQESVPLRGYGSTSNRMSNNVLDPLYATCLAFTDAAGETVLIYTLDMTVAGSPWPTDIVPAIAQATGVAQEYILCSATHTHSAPDMENDEKPSIPRHLEYMKRQCIQAALDALSDRKSAALFGATAQTTGLNFVRRYILQDGTPAGDNYGHFDLSPIARHETEPDRSMQLFKFVREGGEDIIIANFQTHPHRTGGNKKYDVSADIVGIMRTEMEAQTGCRFAYFTGGSGNINPTSRIPEENVCPDYISHGKALAQAALSVADQYRPLALDRVRLDRDTLSCPTDHSQDHRLEDALYIRGNFRTTGDRITWGAEAKRLGFNSVYHAMSVVAKSKRPEAVDVVLNCVSIGDAAFCFAPYEMFDSNGLQIKESSPFPMTMILTCANGSNRGYVPSALGFSNGGYSSDACWFLPGAGERFVEAFLASLNRLFRS